jgi:DEAD/DEAH box helicase domain-containing protein
MTPKGPDIMAGKELCPTLVFDLETKHLAEEVGGWDNIRGMGMSVAVTYCIEEDRFAVYTEAEVQALIRDLLAAKQVIGFNIVRFDYEVLRGYSFHALRESVPTLDLMIPLYQTLGFRPKLEDLAAATLGVGKLGDGLDAVRWYREGELEKLAEYCRRDVEATHQIYRYGKEHGHVLLRDRYRGSRRVPVSW